MHAALPAAHGTDSDSEEEQGQESDAEGASKASDATAACMSVIGVLKGLTPSAVDFELRCLADDASGASLLRMLQLLTIALRVRPLAEHR